MNTNATIWMFTVKFVRNEMGPLMKDQCPFDDILHASRNGQLVIDMGIYLLFFNWTIVKFCSLVPDCLLRTVSPHALTANQTNPIQTWFAFTGFDLNMTSRCRCKVILKSCPHQVRLATPYTHVNYSTVMLPYFFYCTLSVYAINYYFISHISCFQHLPIVTIMLHRQVYIACRLPDFLSTVKRHFMPAFAKFPPS